MQGTNSARILKGAPITQITHKMRFLVLEDNDGEKEWDNKIAFKVSDHNKQNLDVTFTALAGHSWWQLWRDNRRVT